MADDYYDILGVGKDATEQDIKRSFRQIARECHPDRSGSDPVAAERFKVARQAYETLMDPVTRARYDRRGQRRIQPGESFFDAFYRHTGGADAAESPAPERPASKPTMPRGRAPKHDPGNDVGLDDLFNDFGFGGARPKPTARPRPGSASEARVGGETRPSPRPGDDVHVDLEVSAQTASSGGSVTAVYHRLQRSDSWRPGMTDPGLTRVQDIADIRIIPGTRAGEILRERGLGNAGAHGGPFGDLIVRVRVAPPRPTARPEPSIRPEPPASPVEPARRPPAEPTPAPEDLQPAAEASPRVEAPPDGRAEVTLDISVVEAMLGGRVPMETAHGTLRLTIAPGSSSGTRLRLKGKGPRRADGLADDLYVVLRVMVPRTLDAESRRLIEAFARLNPDLSR
jgi:DnaJ-class molecular chaperone